MSSETLQYLTDLVKDNPESIDEITSHLKKLRMDAQKPLFDVEELDQKYVWPDLCFTLKDHQKVVVAWMLKHMLLDVCGIKGGVVAVDTGLGKSIMMAATAMMVQGCHLIVCEKNMLDDLSAMILKYTKSKQPIIIFHKEKIHDYFYAFNSATAAKNKFIITTYDVITSLGKAQGFVAPKKVRKTTKAKPPKPVDERLLAVSKAFFNTEWACVYADESQKLSKKTNQLYQCMRHLKAGGRFGCTSTPMKSNESELECQMAWMGLDIPESFTIQTFEKYGLTRAVINIRKSDIISDIPKLTRHTVPITLNETETNLYRHIRSLATDVIARFKANTVTYTGVLSAFTQLRQVCTAPHLLVYGRDVPPGMLFGVGKDFEETWVKTSDDASINSSKMNKLIEIIRTLPSTDKILIFSEWVGPIRIAQRRLMKEFPGTVALTASGETKGRSTMYERFRNEERCRFLCLTTGVGGKGITFTEANHVFCLEPSWTPVEQEQAVGRIERIGQLKPCSAYFFQVNGSIEENMVKKCAEKKAKGEKFLQDVTAKMLEDLL